MLRLGAPDLVRVERDRDNCAATKTSSDQGAKALSAHGLIVARRKAGQLPGGPGVHGKLDGLGRFAGLAEDNPARARYGSGELAVGVAWGLAR